MAIGKSEPAGGIVVRRRNILPSRRFEIVEEKAVIYGIRMLIQDEPGLGRFWYGSLFQVLEVLREKLVKALGGRIIAWTKTPKNRIHRNAAQPRYIAGGADLFTYTIIIPGATKQTVVTMDGAQNPPVLQQALSELELLRSKIP